MTPQSKEEVNSTSARTVSKTKGLHRWKLERVTGDLYAAEKENVESFGVEVPPDAEAARQCWSTPVALLNTWDWN